MQWGISDWIFHTKRKKIFSNWFSNFSQTQKNITIFLENDLLENIFQKRDIFCKIDKAHMYEYFLSVDCAELIEILCCV